MTAHPKVSVIIPTYNRAHFICEAIESVLSQSYKNFEIIVVDDGSTDGTEELLHPYRDRIRYYYQENQGESAARNTGIRRATGQYIAFLDSDDLWLPEKLEVQVTYLESHPEVGLVHTTGFWEWSNGDRQLRPYGICPSGYVFPQLFLHPVTLTPSVVARRECFDVVGLFDPEIYMTQDTHMWLRIARHFHFGYIHQPLVVIRRQHGTNVTADRLRFARERVSMYEKLVRQNPEIEEEIGASVVRRVLFNCQFTLAYALFDEGDSRAARPYFASSIRLQPWNWASYGYYLTSWLPQPWIKGLRRLKRNVAKLIKFSEHESMETCSNKANPP